MSNAEQEYLENYSSPSPDPIDFNKLEYNVSDLHPVVENRFKKIEEEMEGIKDAVLPFLETRFFELEQKFGAEIEKLRLAFLPDATPETPEKELPPVFTAATEFKAPEGATVESMPAPAEQAPTVSGVVTP